MTIDYKTLNIRKTEYFYRINKTKSKTFPLFDASTCGAAILWEEPVCNGKMGNETDLFTIVAEVKMLILPLVTNGTIFFQTKVPLQVAFKCKLYERTGERHKLR